MKRLIFLMMFLYSSVFSAEDIQINWKSDLKEVGTHGNYRAEWTKSIKMPEGCRESEERRLDEIVLVSTNILNTKPTEWLNGKYLEYVNSSCDIWENLRGTPADFEKRVDEFLEKNKKQNNSGKKDKNTDSSGFLAFVLLLVSFASLYFVNMGIRVINNKFK